MKIRTTTVLLAAAAILQSAVASAQVATQELYSVKFKATCKPGDDASGRTHKMNERDLIEQVVGTGVSARDLKRNYAVVYNPSADSIQVVNRADGAPLGDVFLFEGGTNTVSGDQLTRFVFVFSPNQSDAIGSAVITERAITGDNNRARITGKIQFTMPSGQVTTAAAADAVESNGENATNVVSNISTNSDSGSGFDRNLQDNTNIDGTVSVVGENFVQADAAAASTTAADICSGTFSAGKLFHPGTGNNNDNSGDNNNDSGTGDTNTTGTVTGVDNTSTNAPGSTNTLDANSVDARFLTQAAQANLLEIQLATLAAQTSTNQDVVNYATELIQDHTQSNAQLQQLAGQKGITVSTTLSTANQSIYDSLARLQGQQFDRNFLNRAVSSHQSSIQLYNNEIARGQDADVKAFASANLPALQQHLAQAQQLRTQL